MEDNAPLVSIVIPAYHAGYLDEAKERPLSRVSEHRADSDRRWLNTREVLEKIRPSVLTQENMGCQYFNKGWNMSKGRYSAI